jgi:hypothetical protein
MQHDVQDAYDAHQRAQAGSKPGWDPVLAADELEPGHWRMVAQYDRVYGDIRLVRRGNEIGYRAADGAGQPIGYFRTLRASARAIHTAYIAGHSQAGGVNG